MEPLSCFSSELSDTGGVPFQPSDTEADCAHPPIQPRAQHEDRNGGKAEGGEGNRGVEKRHGRKTDQHTGITEEESRSHLDISCLNSHPQ